MSAYLIMVLFISTQCPLMEVYNFSGEPWNTDDSHVLAELLIEGCQTPPPLPCPIVFVKKKNVYVMHCGKTEFNEKYDLPRELRKELDKDTDAADSDSNSCRDPIDLDL